MFNTRCCLKISLPTWHCIFFFFSFWKMKFMGIGTTFWAQILFGGQTGSQIVGWLLKKWSISFWQDFQECKIHPKLACIHNLIWLNFYIVFLASTAFANSVCQKMSSYWSAYSVLCLFVYVLYCNVFVLKEYWFKFFCSCINEKNM